MKLKKLLERYVDEALGDDIPDYMKDILKKRYDNSDKYLDMDVPEHTDIIPNVKIEVKDENITQKSIGDIVDHFAASIGDEYHKSELHRVLTNVLYLQAIVNRSLGISESEFKRMQVGNRREEYIPHLANFYRKKFRLLIAKDNNLFDPKFSNNTSGLGKFLQSAQRAFPNEFGSLDIDKILTDKRYVGLRDPILNYHVNKKQVENAKLYLYISDKPDDKLRMSISKFYDSCQNLYSGGDRGTAHNKKLLANVFDGNSKVAYLIFDTPFRDSRGNTHPFTSIARTILRVNEEGGVMFDKVYPMDMADVFYQIIGEYTELENVGKRGDLYHFKGVGLPAPYMDKYRLKNTGVGANVDSDLLQALLDVTGEDPKDVEEIADGRYTIRGNEEWWVSTYEDALEYTRDDLLDSFTDLFHDQDLSLIVRNGVIPFSYIEEAYLDDETKFYLANGEYEEDMDLDDEDVEVKDYDEDVPDWDKEGLVLNYLEETGISKVGDLNLSYRDAHRIVDVEALIQYFGGEHEAITFSLAHYDGNYEEVGDLIVVRTG